MNEIKVEDIKVGGAFSEDAYIFNDMIFMPKKTHIKDFHIKALEDWKISSVSCEGVFMTADRSSDLESSEDTGNSNALNAATSNNNEKSTDSTVIDTKNNELKAVYFEWVKKLTLFCETIIRANTLNRVALQNMIQDMEAVIWKKSDAIQLIMGTNIPNVSRVLRQSIDCALYSLMMAKRMNMAVLMKNNLVLGSLFHDIGMLKIPNEILTKDLPLTEEDKQKIREHTVNGFVCLRDAKFTPIIASAALQHHERIDGSGYPQSKQAAEITNVGKIVGILDTYSASISVKEFGKPIHAKEAVNNLPQLSGTSFDPQLVKEFVKSISFYPLGSMVLLSNGIPAKVIGNSGIAMRPIVQVVVDGKEQQLNLREHTDIYIKTTYVPDSKG
ncbi:MAG: HD domain-containing protein [Spirochaetales bacterium]|nr:HD domain-containing protein [Spirochaetales bacterium]